MFPTKQQEKNISTCLRQQFDHDLQQDVKHLLIDILATKTLFPEHLPFLLHTPMVYFRSINYLGKILQLVDNFEEEMLHCEKKMKRVIEATISALEYDLQEASQMALKLCYKVYEILQKSPYMKALAGEMLFLRVTFKVKIGSQMQTTDLLDQLSTTKINPQFFFIILSELIKLDGFPLYCTDSMRNICKLFPEKLTQIRENPNEVKKEKEFAMFSKFCENFSFQIYQNKVVFHEWHQSILKDQSVMLGLISKNKMPSDHHLLIQNWFQCLVKKEYFQEGSKFVYFILQRNPKFIIEDFIFKVGSYPDYCGYLAGQFFAKRPDFVIKYCLATVETFTFFNSVIINANLQNEKAYKFLKTIDYIESLRYLTMNRKEIMDQAFEVINTCYPHEEMKQYQNLRDK